MKTVKELMREREWKDMSAEEQAKSVTEWENSTSEMEKMMLHREVIEKLRREGKLGPNYKG